MVSLEDVRQQLLDAYDPDEIVDVLNISTEEILDRFEDKVVEYMEANEKGEDVEE